MVVGVPVPRGGTGVELAGRRLGGQGDLLGVGEGLAGQRHAANQPAAALLEVQPAGADRDEHLTDAGPSPSRRCGSRSTVRQRTLGVQDPADLAAAASDALALGGRGQGDDPSALQLPKRPGPTRAGQAAVPATLKQSTRFSIWWSTPAGGGIAPMSPRWEVVAHPAGCYLVAHTPPAQRRSARPLMLMFHGA
jgi:hypothetical protein